LLFDIMAQSGKKLAEYRTWHKHNGSVTTNA
jgi:hypothetical protein